MFNSRSRSRSERKATHGVSYVANDAPQRVAPGHVFRVRLTLENTGTLPWNASSPWGDHVGLAVAWDGQVVENHKLPRPQVEPGRRATLHFVVTAPLDAGAHALELDLVHYTVARFSEVGSPALKLAIEVEPQPVDPRDELWSAAQRVDAWHHLPTRGLRETSSGVSLPVFAERAHGCHLWDQSGRRYIDYTMGWGTVLLGYAHPHVSAALRGMLDTGAMVSWPRALEIDVARMLTEDFPGAEMVCFGKNGSDACTFAARMARIFTKRKTILFSGYHGWQDFWVEWIGFERTGVAPREPQLIHRFPFHDLAEFQRLFEIHKGDLAAVMIEPSPWAGDGLGYEPDSDATFLHALADAAHSVGALFIMDEIVTGYRYPGGSVQKAKGVRPDLTCVGKAIASGLPLSAVIGRADVFKQALPSTFYAATFHSESYSLAAAKASIEVCRREPVAQHVWDYGVRLHDGIHRLCRELGVDARVKGPPFRACVIFGRADATERHLERTLFHQKLLEGGVTTYAGVMLPCYAHDEAALAESLDAVGAALEVVAAASKRGNWDELLEIPPLLDL